MIDLRYATALQMVLSLAVAQEDGARCTSAQLAAGLGANPVLVRKLLVPLAAGGIVFTSPGKNGGVRLGRSPEEITLLQVYRAAVEEKRIFSARLNVPRNCIVSRNIEEYFESLADDAESELNKLLSSRTIAQSLSLIREMDGKM